MNVPKQEQRGFFHLPAELRNQIYRLALCCAEEVHLNAQQVFKRQCSPTSMTPKSLIPSILRANRRLYNEAVPMLYGDKTFFVLINESSHHRTDYVVPALWCEPTRRSIYLVRTLVIDVQLRREYFLVENMEVEAIELSEALEIKAGFISVVRNALEELCMVLGMAKNLQEIEIRFVDRGWAALTQGNEHMCLEPLLCLKGLKRVICTGVPRKFAEYLEHSMRQEKIDPTG
ncbi:MAG: hypothetical protein M1836_007854 [Candelina mexicana]|nr:MAG: hypothetical protein M1836_007854 [Candelina mexicana]